MNKAYIRINWENYPSDATPINKVNLNRLDSATDILDDRVITLDTTKATKTEVATLVADVAFEESTGIITVTKKNGSKITIDTQMGKIAVNFDYDPVTEQIILTLIDGTKQYIDLSALITQYEFLDTDTVAFTIGTDGKVSAIVKEGSIEEKHLEPNYLAKIKVEAAKAETSRADAAASATKAESYAVGGTGSREGEDSDNAKYYYQQAKDVSEGLKGGLQPHGTVAFADLPALPDVSPGWMYNISDEFTTTDDFKEGSGSTIPAGANIYKTSDGKWDVLAGTPVTGVKGVAEETYRRGNVNITPADIGLGNADNTADNDKNVNRAKFVGYADNVCNQLTTRTYKGTARDNGFMFIQADLDNKAVILGINGLGETGVAYAKSAGSANAAHCMRTYAADGTSHGDSYKLVCKYNTNSDNRFFLQLEDRSHEISVAHARTATAAVTATDPTKMPVTGGTFTGAVGFANGAWNPVGDDCYMGDFNVGGCVALKSMSSQLTGIALVGAGSGAYGRLLVQNDGGDMYLATNGAFYVSNGNNSARAPIYASAFTQSSSRRVKKNIEDMTETEAEKLLDVEVKSYDYINPDMPDGCFGCIAEDMAKIIPSCVNGDVDCADDDSAAIQGIGIDYSKLVPHLIKMVQIQQAQIDAQQEQIDKLAARLL